ncbi:hypothetical protein ACKZDW_09160 [Ralstonia syzygii subsp. celebesensis]|uniref:hypothetical protein n=1 Tax=Ralstonia syzygii TaxID=28097 RepID=UPI00387E0B1D
MTSMQPKYGSATDVAKRIREWLGPHGRENTASLLLHEALQALEAQSTIGVGDGSGNLFVRGDHDAIKCVQGYIFDAEKWRAAQPGADARAARALCAAAAKRSDKTDGELWGSIKTSSSLMPKPHYSRPSPANGRPLNLWFVFAHSAG